MAENGQMLGISPLSKEDLEAQVSVGLQNIESLAKRMLEPGLILKREDCADIILANIAGIHFRLKKLRSITSSQ